MLARPIPRTCLQKYRADEVHVFALELRSDLLDHRKSRQPVDGIANVLFHPSGCRIHLFISELHEGGRRLFCQLQDSRVGGLAAYGRSGRRTSRRMEPKRTVPSVADARCEWKHPVVMPNPSVSCIISERVAPADRRTPRGQCRREGAPASGSSRRSSCT